MTGKEDFVPSRIIGVVGFTTLLGNHDIKRVNVELDSGAEFLAPPRFGIKIEKGDLVYIYPRTYSSKLPFKGGVHSEYEDPNARWVKVIRGEKIVTRFDIPSTAIKTAE